MAITFVGYFTGYPGSPTPADLEETRKTGANPAELSQKVREFPSKLPPTCNLVGSWATLGANPAGVMVVEAESFADLAVINNHYRGWLLFDWHPTTTGGVQRT